MKTLLAIIALIAINVAFRLIAHFETGNFMSDFGYGSMSGIFGFGAFLIITKRWNESN